MPAMPRFTLKQLLLVVPVLFVVLILADRWTRTDRSIAYIEGRGGKVRHELFITKTYVAVDWDESGVTDDELYHVVRVGPQGWIHLNGNPEITDRGMQVLSQLPFTPQELHIKGSSVTEDGIAAFKTFHPTCNVFH